MRKLTFILPLFFWGASCSLPETPLWNDRESGATTGQSSELITKVLLHGSFKSMINNPVTGTGKGLSMWWERSKLLGENFLSDGALLNPAYARGAGIEEALDLVGMPRPVPGKVDLLVDGEEFFNALHQSVDSAKDRVDTQVYIFDNDDVATGFADRLKARSAEIRCRVLMDRLGSISGWWNPPATRLPDDFKAPPSMEHYLEKGSKVRVRMSQNPWFVADHSKLFLIDGREAYLGGMNIGREYRHEWHDLMVRVTGPVVTPLQGHFDRSWKLQAFLGDLRVLFHREPRPARMDVQEGEHPVRILKTTPARAEIEEAMLVAIRMSRKRIFLENPYVTSELLLRELIAARKRGVEVHFIYPKENDIEVMTEANRRFAASLLEHGGKAYVFPRFSHVKAVLVDDWICLGSANFDGLSLRINGELNIAYTDPRAAENLLRRVFLKDIRESRALRRGDLKVSPFSLSKPLIQQL